MLLAGVDVLVSLLKLLGGVGSSGRLDWSKLLASLLRVRLIREATVVLVKARKGPMKRAYTNRNGA